MVTPTHWPPTPPTFNVACVISFRCQHRCEINANSCARQLPMFINIEGVGAWGIDIIIFGVPNDSRLFRSHRSPKTVCFMRLKDHLAKDSPLGGDLLALRAAEHALVIIAQHRSSKSITVHGSPSLITHHHSHSTSLITNGRGWVRCEGKQWLCTPSSQL